MLGTDVGGGGESEPSGGSPPVDVDVAVEGTSRPAWGRVPVEKQMRGPWTLPSIPGLHHPCPPCTPELWATTSSV